MTLIFDVFLPFSSGITTSTAISLNNLTIGSDHFLVICVPLAANYNFSGYPSGTCNKVVGTGGPADSDGNDKIAIVSGVPAGNFSIIDIYGVPGEVSNTTTGHFFQKGHAVRVAGRTTPKSAWDRNDWISKSYVTTMMTPRQWDAELVASPTSSPASTPVSSKPTSIPTLAPTFGCDSSIQDVTSGIKSIGQKVTICSGFVTAIVYNGFFIQESPSSSGSSSGLFIFTNTGGSKPQFIGMGIKVTGTIALYNGMMELISPQFTVLPTTKTFEAISIKLPVADFSVFNAYQGMLVDIVADTSYSVVVSEFYNLDRFGEVVVCAADANVGRLYQYSSTNLPNVTGYSNHLDLLKRSCVSIDDNSNVQNPKPIRFGGLYPVSTNDFHLRGGQIVTKLKGPLWTNTAYNKYYYVMTLNQQDLSVDPSVNPRPPTPAVIVDSGDIKVVSSNLLNYFTTLNVRGANSAVEFERQVQKTLSALNALNADVYAFTELENSAGNPAVNDLVARLNAANPSRFYVATSVLANLTLIGDDAIKCDIVFDSTLFDLVGWAILTDDQVPQDILSNSTLGCVYCASRVPIAASLRHKLSGNNVTVVTNHLKSKGNTENNAVGKDLDQMDGAALFNYIRLLSVQALLRWLDTNP
jgi:predicted extracellular nuclease